MQYWEKLDLTYLIFVARDVFLQLICSKLSELRNFRNNKVTDSSAWSNPLIIFRCSALPAMNHPITSSQSLLNTDYMLLHQKKIYVILIRIGKNLNSNFFLYARVTSSNLQIYTLLNDTAEYNDWLWQNIKMKKTRMDWMLATCYFLIYRKISSSEI